jgi:hypothetical protein
VTQVPQDEPSDLETALLQAGELLLNGWGYNWYRAENLMRADDVLLRNQADQFLGDALAAFRRAETLFRQKYMGAPSRQNPLPDPARIAELQALRTLLDSVEALRTRLRGAAMPPDDKIWRRHRDEPDLLSRLGSCDARLVASAQALRTDALAITPAGLAAMPGLMEPRLRALEELLRQRGELLNVL